MTQRIRLDDLTDDQLDTLYAERDRYRTAWHSARERAQAHQEGTLRHVADRDAWKVWTKKAEEAVQYWYDAAVERLERAKQAEATLTAVRAVANRWAESDVEVLRRAALVLAKEALDQHGQTPA